MLWGPEVLDSEKEQITLVTSSGVVGQKKENLCFCVSWSQKNGDWC